MSSLFEKALEKIEQDHEEAGSKQRADAVTEQRVRRSETAESETSPVRVAPVRDLPPAVPPPARDRHTPVAPSEPAPRRPVADIEPVQDVPAVPSTATPAAAGAPPTSTPRTSNYAEIDLDALAAAGMVTPNAAESVLAEQHRMVKRPLLLKAFPPSGKRVGNENVILVTSSVPAEGKTFVSVNLAMSIAMEVDRTVLLVDGDPAKGNITKMFGITAERGLTDYLTSTDVELADVLVRTNIPNLVLLPSGKHVANVTELFSSEQMKRLTDELASRYSDRAVIIDSAPLLATSGTRVLAALSGQVLFVVEAVRTTQSAVREALHMIETHPNIGLVLNKSRERPRSSYQYGYYGAQG